MLAREITIMALLAVLAATAHAAAPAASDAGEKSWMTLDQFLQQAPTQPDASLTSQPQLVLLPSLGPQRAAQQAMSGSVVVKPVELAALPPLFERPKSQPKVEPIKKAASGKQVLPKLVAEVETPTPLPTAACAKTEPDMTQKAKNYASDSATLQALHRAVQDLQVSDKMDFLLPAKTSPAAAQGAAAQSKALSTPMAKP